MLSSYLTMVIWLSATAFAQNAVSQQQKFEEYYWGDWTSWSSCDRLCSSQDGTKSRIRICFRIANNQRLIASASTCQMRLDGSASDDDKCYEPECDGSGSFTATWSSWEPWICSYDVGICGRGSKTRVRHCSNPDSVSMTGGRVGNNQCPRGDAMEEDECFAQCPEQLDKYGGWSDWTPWTCERECVLGVEAVRTRACDNPPPVEGYTCPGENREVQPCHGLCTKSWGEWGQYSSCTKTCDEALRVRTRECNQGFGMPCQGEATEKSECLDTTRHTLCPPVDGGWGIWTYWTQDCSVTCGIGVRIRERLCNRPEQAGLGADCVGVKNETRECFEYRDVICPVHGEWLEWSAWIDCSATCGGGEGTRTRSCTTPQHGGRPCEGPAREEGLCNAQTCPPPTVPPALAQQMDANLEDSEFSLIKEEGDIAEMRCADMRKAQEYLPEARMIWTRNGKDFQFDGLRVRIDMKTLVFEEVLGEDNGVYLCQVEYGGIEPLTVGVYSLAVRVPHSQVYVRSGEQFNLTCNGDQLGLLFDGCTQKWFKDERAVKSYGDTPPQEASLEIFRHVDERFEGTYSCVVYHPSTERQWTTNIVNVTVLPPMDLIDVLWSKAQSNIKVVSGATLGIVVLLVILVFMCVLTCKPADPQANVKSKAKAAATNPDEGDHVALYDDGYGNTDDYYGNNSSYQQEGYDDSYQQEGYDNYNYDY